MTTILIILMLAFGLYAWLSSLEIGISVLRCLNQTTLTRFGISLYRPLWIFANIFLLSGIVGFILIFPSALVNFKTSIQTTLYLLLGLLLIHTLLSLYLFYGRTKKNRKIISVIFIASTILMPLCLGSIGTYLLSGQAFYKTSGGWWLMIGLSLGLLAASIGFIYYTIGQTPQGRISVVSRYLNIIFCLYVLLAIESGITKYFNHLHQLPLMIYMIVVSLLLLMQLILYITGQERYMWFYVSLITVSTPIQLAFANQPYLIYPKLLTLVNLGEYTGLTTYGLGLIVFVGAILSIYFILRPTPSFKNKN